MAQFSVKIMRLTGSVLGENQHSPILNQAIVHAIMAALDTHAAMSKQALQSETIQQGLKDALMGPGRLYETLRDRAA